MKIYYLTTLPLIVLCAGWAVASAELSNPVEPGFVRIFNGTDLTGWEGDPKYWSVMDNVIRGQGTRKNFSKVNTFLIWRGGLTTNFILKLKFKMYYGNSGVQYRSVQVSDEHSRWRVFGYQSEVADTPCINGFLFDENPRGVLAHNGEFVVVHPDGKRMIAGQVCDAVRLDEAEFSKTSQWNDCTIIARGNHFMHFVNGCQIIEAIDEDPKRRPEGILALQIHGSGPGIVEFKDIYIKHLSEQFDEALCLFDGQDFSGWSHSSNDVKEAWSIREAGIPRETEEMIKIFHRKPEDVVFNNKVMVRNAGPRSDLRTTADFANYVLRFQFKHDTRGDNAVLLRMVGADSPAKAIKVELSPESAGKIRSLGDFPLRSEKARSRKADREPSETPGLNSSGEGHLGEWSQCEITLNGGELEVKIDDSLQDAATKCWETPGKIAFQSGGPMELRNVVLIPIVK